MPKKPSYVYGQSPAPTSWGEAAEVLKAINSKPKRKSSGLMERIAAIEKLLEKK